MNITVELPITVHVDNVGVFQQEKYRRQNTTYRYKKAFVKEYQEDGKIIIKFVKSEDNEADILTKNTRH